ncbi:MAG: glycosyltransferase family 4 protein [Sphingomonadaceae bacterium]
MPRRIIINGKFLRAESTGVHRVATELANALADLKAEAHPAVAGFDFEVWHTRDGTVRAAEMRLPTRCLDMLTGIPWEQLSLPLRQGAATLLNLCNIGPVASANAVTMVHDAQVHLSPQSYRRAFRLWYRFVQPILGARNRRLLTVSAFSKEQIVALGLCKADRIGVVHNGVDHIDRVVADPDVVPRLGLAAQRYVVALSTTQAHKNIRILLEAFADPALADVRLVLIGGTGRDAFLAAGLEIPANAVFAGRVSDEELRALMESALCLAFPSTTEGFGLPPLEAMRVGCPTLVAPCGAIPEVCGDATEYIDPGNAALWRDAVLALAANPNDRAALVEAGYAQAARFTWRNAALVLAGELARG